MKRSLIVISILSFLCAYTFFKILVFMPDQVGLSALVSFSIIFLMIKGLRFQSRWQILNIANSMLTGFWSLFVILSIPVDLGLIIYSLVKFVSIFTYGKQAEIFVLGLSSVLSLLGFIEVMRGPKVQTVECKIPNLPNDLKNFRIAQISDLHVGPTIKRKYIERVVKQVNALNPDAVFVTGDFADAQPQAVANDIQPLSELSSKYGVFYVTGNHEYYWGANEWITAVTDLGFIPLINENKIITVNQANLMIAGITDAIGGNFIPHHIPNIPEALHTTAKTDIKILLSHRPDPFKEAEENGVHLQFSGHTHGGQYFPFNLLISFFHQYYSGLNRYKNLWLYVNTGTGYWGPINRLGVRAEITLCVLK